MLRIKRTFSLLLLVVVACINGIVHAELASGIKAIVHDSVITYQEVDLFAAPAVKEASRQYSNNRDRFMDAVSEVISNSLEQLVDRQLVLRDFKAAGYNLPESIIDETIQGRIREKYGDRKTLIKTLQAEGMQYEKFRQEMRDQIIVDAMRGKNISSELIISPRKMEKYYSEHATNYSVEDEVKLRMIVLNKSGADDTQARKLADDIETKLKEGATFSEMASVYSQGSQRGQGGDWGWVERSVLRKELAEAAFGLKAGERSPVIETPQACYLMLVEDTKPAHIRSLSEVREEIEKTLEVQERARLAKQYIDKLKAKTFVRYF